MAACIATTGAVDIGQMIRTNIQQLMDGVHPEDFFEHISHALHPLDEERIFKSLSSTKPEAFLLMDMFLVLRRRRSKDWPLFIIKAMNAMGKTDVLQRLGITPQTIPGQQHSRVGPSGDFCNRGGHSVKSLDYAGYPNKLVGSVDYCERIRYKEDRSMDVLGGVANRSDGAADKGYMTLREEQPSTAKTSPIMNEGQVDTGCGVPIGGTTNACPPHGQSFAGMHSPYSSSSCSQSASSSPSTSPLVSSSCQDDVNNLDTAQRLRSGKPILTNIQVSLEDNSCLDVPLLPETPSTMPHGSSPSPGTLTSPDRKTTTAASRGSEQHLPNEELVADAHLPMSDVQSDNGESVLLETEGRAPGSGQMKTKRRKKKKRKECIINVNINVNEIQTFSAFLTHSAETEEGVGTEQSRSDAISRDNSSPLTALPENRGDRVRNAQQTEAMADPIQPGPGSTHVTEQQPDSNCGAVSAFTLSHTHHQTHRKMAWQAQEEGDVSVSPQPVRTASLAELDIRVSSPNANAPSFNLNSEEATVSLEGDPTDTDHHRIQTSRNACTPAETNAVLRIFQGNTQSPALRRCAGVTSGNFPSSASGIGPSNTSDNTQGNIPVFLAPSSSPDRLLGPESFHQMHHGREVSGHYNPHLDET